jgi:GT2 family glycosyltransferase
MTISVIIPNWNGRNLLSDCLDSIRGQTFRDTEVIVVDNGSTDGSIEFIESFFPEIRVVRLDTNYGFAIAANQGICHAVGDKIALLNNDTVAESTWLEELSKALDKFPDVGFCASKILNYWKPNIIDSAGDVLDVASAHNRGQDREDQPDYDKNQYLFGACAGAAIYRRELLDKIGLFDQIFVSNFEDVDLSFRAQLAGFKCLYVPTAIVYHKRGETRKRIHVYVELLSYRNKKILWLKNAPNRLLLKYLPQFLFADVISFLRALYNSTGLAPKYHKEKADNQWGLRMMLKSFVWTYRELMLLLPYIYRERTKIQKTRVVSSLYIESLMRS